MCSIQYKLAIFSPIYKQDKKKNLENYRPIFELFVFGIFFGEFDETDFLESNKALSED